MTQLQVGTAVSPVRFLKSKNDAFRFPKHINHVYIMLTEQCPLDCEYCYIQDRISHSEAEFADVQRLISMIDHPTPRIIFFGGEPLVKVDLLERVVKHYGASCHYQVITSGLVNWDKFIDRVYMQQPQRFDLQVSWDGWSGATRPLRSGANRQDKVIDTVIKTLEKGIPLQVRCVVNDTNVEHLWHTYETFRMIKQDFPYFTGDFTVAHQKSFAPTFAGHLQHQLGLILESCIQSVMHDKHPYIPQEMMRRINDVITQTPTGSCDAGNYLVMRPNGDLYPCTILSQKHEVDLKVANVNEPKALYNWYNLNVLRESSKDGKCTTCHLNKMCDGGCRYERVENYGKEWTHKVCSFTCDIMEAWATTIQTWYAGMTQEQREPVLAYITRFKMWRTLYDKGMHEEAKKYRTFRTEDVKVYQNENVISEIY